MMAKVEYMRQASAQQLFRPVRTLVYGITQKEVDMSGAHYEIVRRLVGSCTLPPVHDLRERLCVLWHSEDNELVRAEVKQFPIRIIYAEAMSTLQHVESLGLSVPPAIEALAYELAAACDVVTTEILPKFRPDLLCTGANKHFFALEHLESQFMITFLRELQKRDRCASIIWLHDGLWVDKNLSNSIIHLVLRKLLLKLSSPRC